MNDHDELQALRNEVAALASELAALRNRSEEPSHLDDVPPPGIEISEATTRRGWMKAAAAAAVGGTALALGGAQRAAAADADPILIGRTDNVGMSRTLATHNGTGAMSFLFRTESAFTGSTASYPAALGGWTGSTTRRNGIYGFTSVSSGDANGVAGISSSPDGSGVVGRNSAGGAGVTGLGGTGTGVVGEGRTGVSGSTDSTAATAAGVVGVSSTAQARGVRAENAEIGGTALEADAAGNGGTAVDANGGYAGVVAQGFQHGVVASGNTSALLLGPTNSVAPPDRETGQPGGALDVQLLSDSGAASLWFCSAPGAPGVWQKLAGPATAGAFHAIDPTRVYDSRAAQPSPGKLAAGSNRVVSVADGRDLLTGAVVAAGLVPDGATAVTYNLTITQTTARGFVAVAPGGATTFGASAINWRSAGTTIANAGVVKLDLTRQVKVFAEVGATHVIFDITGYYR